MSLDDLEAPAGAAPRPGRAAKEVAHGRRLAERDPELAWGWGTPAGRLRASRRGLLIARGAGLRPGVRALEVGCGTGIFTEHFVRTGAQLVAIDVSSDLLRIARARRLPPDRVQFLETRLEDFDSSEPFDAVIGSSVLHHLDVDAALSAVRTLLRPGGVCSFAEPNLLNPQVFLERRLCFLPIFWYVSPDETAFRRGGLAAKLRRADFVDVTVTPFDWLHPAVPPAFIGTIAGLGRLLERTPLVREFAGSLYVRARRAGVGP
jgi:SAM-dependent methyltransferase